jgi:hypothetical protein
VSEPGADDGYTGPACLVVDSERFDVHVQLRGHFEPIDGRYHWYGRVAAHDALDERLAGAKAAGVLETGTGACPCELAEPDLWGRYRITGESTPPFPVAPSPGIR